jgi:DNA-binding response OmpR family regulator
MKILLIEDEKLLADSMKTLLTAKGSCSSTVERSGHRAGKKQIYFM